jgi:hypothetical protein
VELDTRAAADGRVEVTLGGGQGVVKLKPGQVYDPALGRVADGFLAPHAPAAAGSARGP